jgi:hypothetical protein
MNLVLLAADISQDPVDRAYHMSPANGLCLLHCLIHGSGVRYSVHEKYLVDTYAEDVQNRGGNLIKGKSEAFLDDPVESKSPSKNSLYQVNCKGAIPFAKIGFLLKGPFQIAIRKSGAKIQPVEHP